MEKGQGDIKEQSIFREPSGTMALQGTEGSREG